MREFPDHPAHQPTDHPHDQPADHPSGQPAYKSARGDASSSSNSSADLPCQTPQLSGPDGLAPARYMGLDVGDRRIGIAVSDPLGHTAQPVLTLTRTSRRQDLKSIARLLRKHGCSAIVVGNPMYMSGDLSPQAIKAQRFAELVRAEFKLPVILWDERLTSTEAHRHLHASGLALGEHKQFVDQVAAVLILQNYLDFRRNEALRGTIGGNTHPAGEARHED